MFTAEFEASMFTAAFEAGSASQWGTSSRPAGTKGSAREPEKP
jgi:hypothetical protein